MKRAYRGALALALVGACGQQVDQGSTEHAGDRQTQTLRPRGGPHIMPVSHKTGPKTAAATTKNVLLSYFGGHVVESAKIYGVFWTGAVRKETQDQIGGFFTAVTANPYIDWLKEYNTKDQSIGRGSFGGNITIEPSVKGTSLTNDQIAAELNHQLDLGVLPKADGNSIYMFFFPAGYSIDLGGSKSCQVFCAYHNTVKRAGQSVYYAVMPDVGADGCQLGCGTDANVFNNLTVATSHELVETITDAEVGLATDAAPPLGWYDQASGEIGDICAPESDTLPGTSYLIQKEWSNQCGVCITVPDGSCGPGHADAVPLVGLTSPGSGNTITGPITITADTLDRASGIAKVDLTLDFFFPIASLTKPPFTLSADASFLPAGTYYLNATVTGKNGKQGASGYITFVKK